MRVLLSTWGWRSHFYGLVPLGWALQAAGHEVRVASHPGMVPAITAAGLAAVPLGADLDFAEVFAGQIGEVGRLEPPPASPTASPTASPDVLEPAITPDGGVVRFARALLDDLVAYGRSYGPDLLVWEPFNLAAAVAARALDVPGVQHLWGPDSATTLRLDAEAVLGPLAAPFGLSSMDIRLGGDLLVDPVPPPMQVPLHGPSLPMRFVPYNGAAVVPRWLHEPPARPRVCVTAGTMMAGAGLADRLGLPAIVRAVAELDVEVVVVVEERQRAALGPMPDNVRLADAPLALRLLLPSCAALVQQGGAGTTMTALAAGVPQLALPQVSDQHFNAQRLAVTGAGTWLPSSDTDAAAVRDAVAGLLHDDSWRQAAAAMRERLRAMPSPAAVVDALFRAAGTDRPRTTTGART